jgi:hypothetical protein
MQGVKERGKGARLGCEKTEKQKLQEEKEKKRGWVFLILDISPHEQFVDQLGLVYQFTCETNALEWVIFLQLVN